MSNADLYRDLTAQQDPELIDWLLNAQSFAGDFLKTLAEAALRADRENYAVLRPALAHMREKYPQYARPFDASATKYDFKGGA